MKFNVRLDTSGAERVLRQLSQEVRDKAMAETLSKVADQGRTAMRREIAATFNLTQSDVKPKLYTRKPRRVSGLYVLQAEVYSLSRGGRRSLNMIRFVERKVTPTVARRRAKAGTSGLYAKVLRAGSSKLLKGAFIGNRGRTVFRRIGKERLPIEPVQVIDVPQMFNTRRVNEKVRARMQQQLLVVARQRLNAAIKRLGL
jgi:hypothetical protein